MQLSKQARQQYRPTASLSTSARFITFPDFQSARAFSAQINAGRDLAAHPEQAARAGEVVAIDLIDQILHHVADLYRRQRNPQAWARALAYLEARLGAPALDATLRRFVDEFPPPAVQRGEVDPAAYLRGESEGIPNRQRALEEMLMLWLSNANPAFAPYRGLFHDRALAENTAYPQIITELEGFFAAQPPFGPDHQSLFEMLRAPALAAPGSLIGQLTFIRERWSTLIGAYLDKLLRGMDLIREETKPSFAGFGPGPAEVPDFGDAEYLLEGEFYSADSDWMPRLVLIAKNAYVWLDQLSKEYGRAIRRLDEVPDAELDRLARSGFSGLWLIGLWERSSASQKIKVMCGNPDAVPSAYSLYDYIIAADLGGEPAYENLRRRAGARGIRLAADMVPNHVGIYSRWVVEHPDWFISLDYSPFPTYTFNGPDLSEDPRVGIFLEDHYYTKSDAAVVFKRLDRWTGDEKFIYHGNDGTSMPWNDTAQLNYLKPEVREAVIQTILHVARKFPIIRFDAAMTLTKKHYQRLWFPEPGTGGDIPTRAEFGMTRAEFNAAMPNEFWREVVDRVAAEAPDTLLLAEAFWMMEGYFVRTLGMHRVYNSAFMNMLRDEKNAEYRQLIKNTLEFDPQILKRYVNFMNNPDEETAIEQFGHDDKYFGVCVLMSTLPGLPMFGHGQIEGYREKYGMEYRRAYWNEYPDPRLVRRHEREIFPLLHRRALFAEVEHFHLYDFYTPEGGVNENVFAYSNRRGEDRALVVYHNRWAEAKGWLRTSAARLDKASGELRRVTLAEGLALRDDPQTFTVFREQISGLEYLRSNRELHENGLYIELGAYKYQVFLDFRQVRDDETRRYARLHAHLNGRGVPSVAEALQELLLEPLLTAFRALVNPDTFRHLLECPPPDESGTLAEIRQKMTHLLAQIVAETADEGWRMADDEAETTDRDQSPVPSPQSPAVERVLADLRALWSLCALENRPSDSVSGWLPAPQADFAFWGALLGYIFTRHLGAALPSSPLGRGAGGEGKTIPARASTAHLADAPLDAMTARRWYNDWLLGKILEETLAALDVSRAQAAEARAVVDALLLAAPAITTKDILFRVAMRKWFDDPAVQRLLGVNEYRGITYFRKEQFERLLHLLAAAAALEPDADLQTLAARVSEWERQAAQAGYQVEIFGGDDL